MDVVLGGGGVENGYNKWYLICELPLKFVTFVY